MKHKGGFLLIEVLIFLGLSLMLVLMVCSSILRINVANLRDNFMRDCALYGVIQVLRNDLEVAPINAYSIEKDAISYSTHDLRISWHFDKNKHRLMRRVDYFIKKTQDSTTMLEDVDVFSCIDRHNDGGSLFFVVNLIHKGRKIEEKVWVKNRIL